MKDELMNVWLLLEWVSFKVFDKKNGHLDFLLFRRIKKMTSE